MASFFLSAYVFLLVVLVLTSNAKVASAEPGISFSDILLPSPNVTAGAVGEIKCYALPYGAIGIISHLLTYWTIAWTVIGQVPMWPWHPMKDYKFDMFLAIVGLLVCVPTASITMHRCRLSWHFLLICIWKLITSVSLACITLHRCAIIKKRGPNPKRNAINNSQNHGLQDLNYQGTPIRPQRNGSYHQVLNDPQMFRSNGGAPGSRSLKPLWWITLYMCGTIVGMVGLCSLLYTTFRHDETIRNLTYGFGIAIVTIPTVVAVYWYIVHLETNRGGATEYGKAVRHAFGGAFIAFVVMFGFLSTLYSDMVLGSIADNLSGRPSDDVAPLYWAWFVAKRLPMLSL